MKRLIRFFPRFALGMMLLGLARPPVAVAADLEVFLAPNGDDGATGMVKTEPVATLQAALRIALTHESEHFDHLRIVVAPGVYQGQHATIHGRSTDRPLVIMPESDIKERPRFDGAGQGGTWLTLASESGRPTRITVAGLEITNYVTAISFNGNREDTDASNGHNVVRNNIFRNIGQIAFPSGPMSTAAIRLVNSDHNEISHNKFVTVRNNQGCGALHAVYIAHNSDDNLIANNIFDDGCGSTIKVRDASSANRIVENSFVRQEAPVFEDSYCDKSTRTDCTKKGPECPSQDNEFRNNTVRIAANKNAKKPFYVKGSDRPPACDGVPQGHMRLIEIDNKID